MPASRSPHAPAFWTRPELRRAARSDAVPARESREKPLAAEAAQGHRRDFWLRRIGVLHSDGHRRSVVTRVSKTDPVARNARMNGHTVARTRNRHYGRH